MFKKKERVVLCLLLSLILAPHCYGYIDMSTGSYVVQFLIAGVLGSLFTFRGYAKSIKLKVSSLFKHSKKEKHGACK
jgi:hypothetical protein